MSEPMCAGCGSILPTDEPWTVTVEGHEVELHGLIGNYRDLRAFADAVKPLGLMVIASPMLHAHGGEQ
jgi:enhancing lycopene biosynthesis protein 2